MVAPSEVIRDSPLHPASAPTGRVRRVASGFREMIDRAVAFRPAGRSGVVTPDPANAQESGQVDRNKDNDISIY